MLNTTHLPRLHSRRAGQRKEQGEGEGCAGEWQIGRQAEEREAMTTEQGGGMRKRRKLLKPTGGVCTPEIVTDVLSLIQELPTSDPATWTQKQRDVVYDYAIRWHLRVSDNYGIRLRKRPRLVRKP